MEEPTESIKSIDTSVLNQSDSNLTKTLLFRDPRNNKTIYVYVYISSFQILQIYY